jgi:outer membrane protein
MKMRILAVSSAAVFLLVGVGKGRALGQAGVQAPGGDQSPPQRDSQALAVPVTLTLPQAVERALARFPSIGVARAARDESRASIGEAQAGYYPSLRVNGSGTLYEEPTAVYPIHGFKPGLIPPFDTTIYQGAANVSLTLFDGGGRGSRVRQARSRYYASDYALTGTGQTLTARVISTYLDVLSRAQTLESQDRRIDALEAERARVVKLMDVGRAARLEFLRVDGDLETARAGRIRLATGLDTAERDLALLIDMPLEQTRAGRLIAIDVADTSLASREELLDLALHASPSLSQARSQLASAKAATGVARGLRWPEVKVVGNYVGWSDSKGDDTAEWNAAAQLSLPIFTGGAISSGIEKADAAARGASEQARLTEIQVAQDLDRARSAVLEARAQVVSLSKAVESMTEVVRIEKLALENGSGTQTDYLDGEADLFAARAGLIGARHREIAARAELARVTGSLDPAWLTQTLEEVR